MYASTSFGVLGLLLVITLPGKGANNSALNLLVVRLLMASGFVVLTSFALSVAAKYLNSK